MGGGEEERRIRVLLFPHLEDQVRERVYRRITMQLRRKEKEQWRIDM